MRFSRRTFVVILIVIVAGGGWYYFFGGEDKQAQKQLLAEVKLGDVENAVTAAGSLLPKTIVDVGAQVSGQLLRLHVDVGDAVTQGQLLAEIDATRQSNQVEAARATLRSQEAQLSARAAGLKLAEANAARQERLMAEKATSQADLENAINQLASAHSALVQLENQIEHGQAELATQQAELGYTTIYAPGHGTIVNIAATEGQTLNANDTTPLIMSIANLDTMKVRADVSEADVTQLAIGMPVYFTTLGSGARRWYSEVNQIVPSPTITNNVVLYPVYFDIDNEDRALLTNMTAQVFFIESAAQDVITVPAGALSYVDKKRGRSNRQATVEVVAEDGSQQTREVTIGIASRITAEITSGLEPGETVVAGILTERDRGDDDDSKGRRIRF